MHLIFGLPIRFPGIAVTSAVALGCALVGRGAESKAQTNSSSPEFVIVAPDGISVDDATARQFGVRILTREYQRSSFAQAALKQGNDVARLGPSAERPYFVVRYALPIPPENDTNLTGALVGIDPAVGAHNHSHGLEVLTNGYVLAIYFSSDNSRGASESAPTARFVQARLRYGAEEWDPPELFFDSRDYNDQSGLLWLDGSTIRFFGGGRNNPFPFKMAASTDNGASWMISFPQLDQPAKDYTPQPIVNAFRNPASAMFFAMDAAENESFLWRSEDNGIHWHDMGGRTSARHSTIIPLDENTLLSIGGKNTAVNGYTPENVSANWGETWSEATQSPFAALGGNQRPSLIRLANGHLCFVSDSYHRKQEKAPAGWTLGEGAFIAISKDNGATWRMKQLPVELPHESDRKNGTLGDATARQGPNGVIHILATMTHPCLHYELNEAWVFSDAGDIAPEISGGKIEKFSEKYPSGKLRVAWSARICPGGRYLLEGKETSFYEDGRPEHEATYVSGRKTGSETFWSEDGAKVWRWNHHLNKNSATWTQYWSNGRKRIKSNWNTKPRARDLARNFIGREANGPAYHWNAEGKLLNVYQFNNGVLIGDSNRVKSK
jgi:hypothetical protein